MPLLHLLDPENSCCGDPFEVWLEKGLSEVEYFIPPGPCSQCCLVLFFKLKLFLRERGSSRHGRLTKVAGSSEEDKTYKS